jgi:hypothetical protein
VETQNFLGNSHVAQPIIVTLVKEKALEGAYSREGWIEA